MAPITKRLVTSQILGVDDTERFLESEFFQASGYTILNYVAKLELGDEKIKVLCPQKIPHCVTDILNELDSNNGFISPRLWDIIKRLDILKSKSKSFERSVLLLKKCFQYLDFSDKHKRSRW